MEEKGEGEGLRLGGDHSTYVSLLALLGKKNHFSCTSLQHADSCTIYPGGCIPALSLIRMYTEAQGLCSTVPWGEMIFTY